MLRSSPVHPSLSRAALALGATALGAAFGAAFGAGTACVLDLPIGSAPRPLEDVQPLPASEAVDVLFVVDNSGSMLEEHARLVAAIFNPACPIQSLTDIPPALRDPDAALLAQLLPDCGLTQVLAAYGRDFNLGFITTDVNACDNVVPLAQGGAERGHRPQRGCLQPVPSSGQRILRRSDEALGARVNELLAGIAVHGSPFERGLDAVDMFLSGTTFSDECAGDRDRLLRSHAALLIVFLTDEDDCSHADGRFGFDSETSAVCGEDIRVVTDHSPTDCIARRETLAPVSAYAESWRLLKGAGNEGAVAVAVLGGAVNRLGAVVPAGCVAESDGRITDACEESGGLSHLTGPGQPCDPQSGVRCCAADAATRYFELATRLGAPSRGSICAASYAPTMIAAFGFPGGS
jgi:hypothetical protein